MENHIKTRDSIEESLNKGLSIEEIAKRLCIRIGDQRDEGSVKWYVKCITSKKLMQGIHRDRPEIFTRSRIQIDEERMISLYVEGKMPPYKIARSFGCDTMTIFNRLRKRGVEIRSYSESHLVETYKGVREIKNSGLTVEKAYVLGVLCGDGWLTLGKKKYRFGLHAIDREFVEEFQRCVDECYGLKGQIRLPEKVISHWSQIYSIGINSKKTIEDIFSYGSFSTETWRVPRGILNSDDKGLIGHFLRGFYDSEGCVIPHAYHLKATTTNYEGLQGIRKLLDKLEIHHIVTVKNRKEKKHKTAYEVFITGAESYRRFKEYVGFTIKRKQDRLLKLQNIRSQKRYFQADFERVLELESTGLSHAEIARRTGVIRTTVDKWMKNKRRYREVFPQ